MEETEEGGSHQLVTAAGALRRAPPGERIRLRAGTTLSGEVVCAQPVVLEAEGECTLRGKLTLQAGTLNRSSLIGTVRGLKIAHFMEEAIQVNGGSWALTDCTVVSSRGGRGGAKPQRASTAISLRHGASLQLSGCEVRHARAPLARTPLARASWAARSLRLGGWALPPAP